MALSRPEQRKMALQHYIAWANFLWFGLIYLFVLKFFARYHIRNLAAFRDKANRLLDDAGKDPIIICANHLTLIDSMIITWALSPMAKSLQNFHRVPWHMPEFANFAKNLPLRIMCYLGKSIYVKRGGGTKDRRHSMDQVHWLLSNNHTFCMFPEGGRSRTGRVQSDSVTYSIGEFIQFHPNAKVLCMYVRGDEQNTWGKWPEFGTGIDVDIRQVNIDGFEPGRKGARDIAVRVIDELIALENEYFDRRPPSPTAPSAKSKALETSRSF